jgi:hypothetical protein
MHYLFVFNVTLIVIISQLLDIKYLSLKNNSERNLHNNTCNIQSVVSTISNFGNKNIKYQL